MPQIHIARNHALGLASARDVANALAAELSRRHGLRTHWEGDTLKVKRVGLKGELEISAARVDVRVRLGLSMRFLRAALEREIKEHLDVRLGPEV